MSQPQLEDLDLSTTKYFFARYFVDHIEQTLKEHRWRYTDSGRIIYDLGEAMIALEQDNLDYCTGPKFPDHIMTKRDLIPAVIDGAPHLVVKHLHLSPEKLHPALVDYFESSFLEFNPERIKHGTARTVYASQPVETLRWTTPEYSGPKYKITGYKLLKGECFHVTCQ